MSLQVDDAHHNDDIANDSKIDAVRKAAHERMAKLSVFGRVAGWMFGDPLDRQLKSGPKLNANTLAIGFVPVKGLIRLGLGLRPKDNAHAHFFGFI